MNLFELAFNFKHLSGELLHYEDILSTGKIANLGEKLVKDVKDAHGTYEYGWAELSDWTKEARTNQGYSENQPLLRTREERDSYSARIMDDPFGDGKALIIGSPLDKALWNELGHSGGWGTITPPRPVLLPTVFKNKDLIVETIGECFASLFVSGASDFANGFHPEGMYSGVLAQGKLGG